LNVLFIKSIISGLGKPKIPFTIWVGLKVLKDLFSGAIFQFR